MSPDKFLDAEKRALELVATLEDLRNEAESFSTASDQLQDTRDHMVDLIETFQEIASDTSNAIEIIKTIGGPEIIERIEAIQNESRASFGDQTKRLSEGQSGIIEHLEKIEAMQKESRASFGEQTKRISEVQSGAIEYLEEFDEMYRKNSNEKLKSLSNIMDRLNSVTTLLYISIAFSGIALVIGLLGLFG